MKRLVLGYHSLVLVLPVVYLREVAEHVAHIAIWHDGPITSDYGPAELIGKLAERIAALIRDVAGTPTMLYGIAPGNSMAMFFGDPRPSDRQEQLEFEVTLDAAKRVAELVEADEDDFVARAIAIGAPMSRYDDLVQIVQGEGFKLQWKPRAQPVRVLTPQRAGEQHVRLQSPPETNDWEQEVNGILYRVIAEPGEEKGTAGLGGSNGRQLRLGCHGRR